MVKNVRICSKIQYTGNRRFVFSKHYATLNLKIKFYANLLEMSHHIQKYKRNVKNSQKSKNLLKNTYC